MHTYLRVALAGLLALPAAFAASCAPPPVHRTTESTADGQVVAVPPIQDSVKHVFTTDASAVRARERLVLGDSTEWAESWFRIVSNRTPTPAVPSVDFSLWRIALMNEGTREDAGTARITAITVVRDTLVINVTAFRPQMCPGVLSALNVSKSTDAVLIPRHPSVVAFRERVTTLPCREI